MDFNEYLKTIGLINLQIIIRENSDITIEKVKEIVTKRVNRIANENSDIDVRADIKDLRDGNIYTCFSKNMMQKYNIKKQFVTALDLKEIKELLEDKKKIEIKKIFEKMNITKTEDYQNTQLKCFTCNQKAILKENFIICSNNHKQAVKEYILKLIEIKSCLSEWKLNEDNRNSFTCIR